MNEISNRPAAYFIAVMLLGAFFLLLPHAPSNAYGSDVITQGDSPIPVTNVDELYAAVNDPQNAGRKVVAAPGIYMLSATDASGFPRPNGGRLEFQEDMSLIGVTGDRAAVVINAINMPSSSLTGGAVPLAPI